MASARDSLRVTGASLSRSGQSRRRAARTTVHVDFDTALASEQAELNLVRQMRDDIERKESEIATLRQEMERDNEIDERRSPEELRQLQGAFDRCQADCHRRIDAVLAALHQAMAELDGRRRYAQKCGELAQERADGAAALQHAAGVTMGNFSDPEVSAIDEARLRPLVQEAVAVQRGFDALHLGCGFGAAVHGKLAKFNDDMQRKLNDAIAEEQRAARRAETARKDIEVRCARPRVVAINADWVDASRALSHNLLLLAEVNHAIRLFNDEVGRLAAENRSVNERIAAIREELVALERFLPGEDGQHGHDARFECTQLQTENDDLALKIMIAKGKLQIENDRLSQMQGMLKKMPPELEKQKAGVEAARTNRRLVDESLENVESIRAELLSQKDFANDAKKVMEKRLLDGKAELDAMRAERKRLALILKKQELLISLTEEMAALRKMNLQRVANKVETLLKINSEIDGFED
jgi:chromosome segregation ATPase